MSQIVTLNGKILTSDGKAVAVPENNWMGNNIEFVEKVYDHQGTLADNTNYDDWTASTTTKVCIASVNADTFSAQMDTYEYMLEWIWEVDIAHTEGATLTAMPDRQYGTFYQSIHRRAYGLTNFENRNEQYNYCTAYYTASNYIIYYNTSGTLTWTTNPSYGIYAVVVASTLSGTTANTTTVTIKTPTINARSNTTYFATARKTEVDSANTKFRIIGNLYRADINSSPVKLAYRKAMYLYAESMLQQKGG